MRIAIVGAGAVGGYFGARLARAGEDVTFIARGSHLDAIRTRGLEVVSPALGDFTVRARAEADPAAVGPVDLVIFAVKAYDNDTAIPSARAAGRAGHGGADPAERHRQHGAAGRRPRRGARAGRHHLRGHRRGGAGPHRPDRRAPLDHLRRGVRRAARRSRRASRAIAAVLAPPTSRSPRCPTPGCRSGTSSSTWRRSPDSPARRGCRSARCGASRRCASVLRRRPGSGGDRRGRGRAASPRTGSPRSSTTWTASRASTRSSLLVDLEQGKRIEVEALQGAAVRRAAALGVPVPILSTLYAVLKPWADGIRASVRIRDGFGRRLDDQAVDAAAAAVLDQRDLGRDGEDAAPQPLGLGPFRFRTWRVAHGVGPGRQRHRAAGTPRRGRRNGGSRVRGNCVAAGRLTRLRPLLRRPTRRCGRGAGGRQASGRRLRSRCGTRDWRHGLVAGGSDGGAKRSALGALGGLRPPRSRDRQRPLPARPGVRALGYRRRQAGGGARIRRVANSFGAAPGLLDGHPDAVGGRSGRPARFRSRRSRPPTPG